MNRKPTIRRFQRDQNCRISSCQLGVIALESQCPKMGWKWTVVGQMLNWGVKCWWNLTNQISMESWWNKESNETKKNLDLKSGRNPCFKNQQNSAIKFRRNDEFSDFWTVITYLNLI